MENKKQKLKRNKSRILIAILAVALAVSLAFALGFVAANLKIPSLLNSLNQDQQTLEALSTATYVGSSNSTLSCSILESGLGYLNQQLQTLSTEITAAQTDVAYSSDYQDILNQFEYTRVDYWLLAQRIEDQCGHKIANVLMLYPQNGCTNCVYEGTELTYLEEKSNYSIIATVINANTGITPIEAIDSVYNVSSFPMLIINGNATYVGYEDTSQLLSTICQYSPRLEICA